MLPEMVLLVALLMAAYLIFTGSLSGRRARFYRRIAKAEHTRANWAGTREELLCLVRESKLDVNSATFQAFYSLQTFVLRRPDAYADIAQHFHRYLEFDATSELAESAARMLRERESWPQEMNNVLNRMSEGLGLLLFNHLGFRGYLRLFWRLAPNAALRLLRSLARNVPKLMVAAELREAQSEIQRLRTSRSDLRDSGGHPAAALAH